MSDKTKIYIHIGFGKTGTSSIQALLSKRKNYLLNQGVLYPKAGLIGNVHHGLAPLGAESIDKDTDFLYGQLKQEVVANKPSKVIISTEHFSFVKPKYIEDIQRAFVDFEVMIIFYVRAQDSLIESAFLQWQKVGDNYEGDIEKFFKKYKGGFDFMKRVEPWSKSFGEQAIIARLYDEAVIGSDVCKDFAEIVGLGDIQDLTGEKENPSLLPEFSTLVSMVDAAGIEKEHRVKIINRLLELSKSFVSIKKTTLINDALRGEITEFYKRSNIEFADKYLPKKHADLWKKKIQVERPVNAK